MMVAAMGVALVVQNTPIHADTVHVAKDGDTFYKLSQQYGVSLDKLMNANPNTTVNNIYAGINLNIPTVKNTVSASAVKSTASTVSVIPDQKVVEAWGKTFNYSSTVQVKATAYSAAASENGKWGAVDYFGNPLKLGTIAVDPNVIPMGTKVLVTGHSHNGLPNDAFVATATDAGSAIKGNRIDIFIPGSQQSVSSFGFQQVKLFIIK
ncbi:3D domain-containing protein [Paenibacillus macquariensis]|nr:3D domain-containing protein [Paenibacillus macquariensis]MEC0090771.1 3D domain-containing protein [Paenibacillus macquariensis]